MLKTVELKLLLIFRAHKGIDVYGTYGDVGRENEQIFKKWKLIIELTTREKRFQLSCLDTLFSCLLFTRGDYLLEA
jgi:hypothetical protein